MQATGPELGVITISGAELEKTHRPRLQHRHRHQLKHRLKHRPRPRHRPQRLQG